MKKLLLLLLLLLCAPLLFSCVENHRESIVKEKDFGEIDNLDRVISPYQKAEGYTGKGTCIWTDETKYVEEWSDAEKALLLALLMEIAWADDDFYKTEKESLAKSTFGSGVLEDIMYIQDLASEMYLKGEVGDLEKIANDFNNLSSVKKEYTIKSVSEMMESDGTISPQEIAISNKLTGK